MIVLDERSEEDEPSEPEADAPPDGLDEPGSDERMDADALKRAQAAAEVGPAEPE